LVFLKVKKTEGRKMVPGKKRWKMQWGREGTGRVYGESFQHFGRDDRSELQEKIRGRGCWEKINLRGRY